MKFAFDFEISLNNKFRLLLSMTQKILIGIAITAIMAVIGIGMQSSVWALTENTGDDSVKTITSIPLASSTDTQILVDAPITHKGDKPTFTLVSRPQEGIDGIPLPKPADPDMILTDVSDGKGKNTLSLVPRPVEGIDGIPIPKTTDVNQTFDDSSAQQADPEMMLVATPITHKGGNATFTLVPTPTENVDGIPTAKTTPDLIMVEHTSPTDGKPIYTWIPRPAEGIDGIPIPKSTPSG